MVKIKLANLLLLLAAVLLMLGGAVDETVETIFVLEAAHGGAAVGIILLAVMAGGLIAGPVSTRVIDNEILRRHAGLMVSGMLAIESLAIIASGLWFSTLLTFLVAGFLGFVGTLFWSVFLALLPKIVPNDRLLKVNKWISFSRNAGFTLGPFVGSYLYVEFGVGALLTIGIGAASLGVLLFTVVGGFAIEKEQNSAEAKSDVTLTTGIRLIFRVHQHRILLIAVLLMVVLAAVANVLSVSHITIVQDFDARVFGLYNGAISVGLLLGPILFVNRLSKFSGQAVVFATLVLWALGVVAFSVAITAWQIVAIGFGIGLLNGTMLPFYISHLMSFSQEENDGGKAVLPAYVFCANIATVLGYGVAIVAPANQSRSVLLLGGFIAAILVLLCWYNWHKTAASKVG